jgi:beta-glucosidase
VLLVTENGAAFDDRHAADDSIADLDRIPYIRDHIAAVERARSGGAHVRVYVVSTLLDNCEWAEGYTKKFDLVAVDPVEQHRTRKASYEWFASLVASSNDSV